jgi:hypothetical protein
MTRPESSPEAHAAGLHDRLIALHVKARAFDLRAIEGKSDPREIGAFARGVAEALAEAEAVYAGLAEALPEGSTGASGPVDDRSFLRTLDLLVTRPDQELADVAAVARLELAQRRARLEAPFPIDVWERVCDCGSALRRLTKSLAALELPLSVRAGRAPQLHYRSELDVARSTRRLYRKLWAFVQRTPNPTTFDETRVALRGAGTLIAMLIGRDEYCRFRERDRRRLRELQSRILAWQVLAAPDAYGGLRLWEDFASFTHLLRHVNQRQELADFDRAQVERAWSLLAEPDAATRVPEAISMLRESEGLDPVLDAATSAPGCDVDALQRALLPLRQRFGLVPGPLVAEMGDAL